MTKHIAIIGGGASGTLMAAHLIRNLDKAEGFRITIIDAGSNLGRGLAYSTTNPSHILNVRAAQISAFADDPDHFLRWLERHHQAEALADGFVPRTIYGQYLEDLLADLIASTEQSRLRVVTQQCIGLRQSDGGAEIVLADGSILPAHFVVIASGYGVRQTAAGPLLDPWDQHLPQDRHATVVMIGTGLTMVDKVLSLLDAGHQGQIIAMSRKGLLPKPHTQPHALQLSTADIPLGASIHYLARWLTQLVVAHQSKGGDWRDVMDGMRPHIQTIWKHLPKESRGRFLRHAVSYWDIHRHRMPLRQATRLQTVLQNGQLEIRKGRFVAAQAVGNRTVISFMDQASGPESKLEADVVYDCRGIRRWAEHGVPAFIASLLERGQARLDPLGLGLEFDKNCGLVDADGNGSGRIFGIGPVTLSAFWESIAIPDIRLQAQQVARHLAAKQALLSFV
jgi:uncharacterized NAD(P)/FAD-binding protein YdhS